MWWKKTAQRRLAPTAVFWNPRARTAPEAVTVCYVKYGRTPYFIRLFILYPMIYKFYRWIIDNLYTDYTTVVLGSLNVSSGFFALSGHFNRFCIVTNDFYTVTNSFCLLTKCFCTLTYGFCTLTNAVCTVTNGLYLLTKCFCTVTKRIFTLTNSFCERKKTIA